MNRGKEEKKKRYIDLNAIRRTRNNMGAVGASWFVLADRWPGSGRLASGTIQNHSECTPRSSECVWLSDTLIHCVWTASHRQRSNGVLERTQRATRRLLDAPVLELKSY